jgi:excisionase family DNA binding protein
VSVQLELPDAVIDELVERVATRVLEQLAQRDGSSQYVNVQEAAELLRCKPQRIYDLLSDRRLERIKEGARVFVRRADVVALLLPQSPESHTGKGLAR